MLAEACQRTTIRPPDERLLLEACVFGELLDGDDPLDHVKVALVVNLPSEEVPWESQPDRTGWLVDMLRLNKGGFAYWWRSSQDPVWNHYIREPVRFWSVDGPDEHANYWNGPGAGSTAATTGTRRTPSGKRWTATSTSWTPRGRPTSEVVTTMHGHVARVSWSEEEKEEWGRAASSFLRKAASGGQWAAAVVWAGDPGGA